MKKFWGCSCCLCIVVTEPQDDASRYTCPQCDICDCIEPGTFTELTKEEFLEVIE